MAHASIQFCGPQFAARVYQNGPYVMADLKDNAVVIMEPQHIRALAAALDQFEAIAALKVRYGLTPSLLPVEEAQPND